MKSFLVLKPNCEWQELDYVEDAQKQFKVIRSTIGDTICSLVIPALYERNITAYCSDNHKLLGDTYKPSLNLYNQEGNYDYILGNICFTRVDAYGNTLGLTSFDIFQIKNYFEKQDKTICYFYGNQYETYSDFNRSELI